MEILFIFLRIFALLMALFVGVLVFFVYPVNLLYKNDKITSYGNANRLFVSSTILLVVVTLMLYFYYHISNNYLCAISKYYNCITSNNVSVYILLFVHFVVVLLFNMAFINVLIKYVKTNKLDLYLFLYASVSMFLVVLNYQLYTTLFTNIKLIYVIVRIMLMITAFCPLYLFLLINFVLSKVDFDEESRKKKKKKKTKGNKKETKKVENKDEKKD